MNVLVDFEDVIMGVKPVRPTTEELKRKQIFSLGGRGVNSLPTSLRILTKASNEDEGLCKKWENMRPQILRLDPEINTERFLKWVKEMKYWAVENQEYDLAANLREVEKQILNWDQKDFANRVLNKVKNGKSKK